MKDFSAPSVLGFSHTNTAVTQKATAVYTRRKAVTVFLIILLIAIGGYAGRLVLIRNQSARNSATQASVLPQAALGSQQTGSLAKKDINQEFAFPIGGQKSKETLKYAIESAELMNEIVVGGQKAKAASGRLFLVLNLKLANDTNQGIKINTRDFVRLSVAGQDTVKLAPDIHNDPVEVQAISTKYTRVGFPVSATDKNYVIQVGEINGPKTTIDLVFD